MVKILLIGSVSDSHLLRLIRNVKRYDSDNRITFDVFDIWGECNTDCQYICSLYYHKRHFPDRLYRIPKVGNLLRIFDCKLSFSQVKENYDLVNIHYVTDYSYYVWNKIKSVTKRTLISPWGSDIYRICNNEKKRIYRILHDADFISAPKIRFRDDIEKFFNIPDSKFLNLDFGSETIDAIIDFKEDKHQAKILFGHPDSYIITCGYNRIKEQNHKGIIESLGTIREYLPENHLVVFPFTYGYCTDNYKGELISLLDGYRLRYLFIDNFLTNEENAYLRYASDIFIHYQTTDANAGSVHEHILAGSTVLNGEWLRYTETESHGGTPYVSFKDKEDLSRKLVQVILGKISTDVTEGCREFIRSNAWSRRGREWFDYYTSLENN